VDHGPQDHRVARPSAAARRPGELTTTEASARLSLHERTLRRWASQVEHSEPAPVDPGGVRRDLAGRLWWRTEAISEAATTLRARYRGDDL